MPCVEPGHIVLVVGATGGVGNQVVQLAAAAGARVTVQQVFPLDQAQAAFDTFGQGTLSKVVITTD